MKMNSGEKRFTEIDALRGIAIIMVVIYHLVFDLHFFGVLDGLLPAGGWLIFGRIAAFLFVFLAGVSIHLSFERAKIEKKFKFSKYLARGAGIFALGMIISFATWIYPHDGFIIFGILHLIGICIVLGYFFERFYFANLILGATGIAIGFWANYRFSDNFILFIFGFPLDGLWTLDYFPIFPWLGVFLVGMFFGKLMYPKLRRRISDLKCENQFCRMLSVFGQNTLLIYFVHQPIILLGLTILGVI